MRWLDKLRGDTTLGSESQPLRKPKKIEPMHVLPGDRISFTDEFGKFRTVMVFKKGCIRTLSSSEIGRYAREDF
jgi:hypothetical protein